MLTILLSDDCFKTAEIWITTWSHTFWNWNHIWWMCILRRQKWSRYILWGIFVSFPWWLKINVKSRSKITLFKWTPFRNLISKHEKQLYFFRSNTQKQAQFCMMTIAFSLNKKQWTQWVILKIRIGVSNLIPPLNLGSSGLQRVYKSGK